MDTEQGDGATAYKVAMLGASGVGKTALTYQFTTSEYICAYDLSLDDDYGQKTVSVLLDGQETDLEIIDHPACEMSVSIRKLQTPVTENFPTIDTYWL